MQSFRRWLQGYALALGLCLAAYPAVAAPPGDTVGGAAGGATGSSKSDKTYGSEGDPLLPQHLYLRGRPEKLDTTSGGGKIHLEPQQRLEPETQSVKPSEGERITNLEGSPVSSGEYMEPVSVTSEPVDISAQARRRAARKSASDSDEDDAPSSAMLLLISAASAVLLGAVYWKLCAKPSTRARTAARQAGVRHQTSAAFASASGSTGHHRSHRSHRSHQSSRSRHRATASAVASSQAQASHTGWQTGHHATAGPQTFSSPSQPPGHTAASTLPPWADAALWQQDNPPAPARDAVPVWADAQVWHATTAPTETRRS